MSEKVDILGNAIGHLNKAAAAMEEAGYSSERVKTVRRDLAEKRGKLEAERTAREADPLTARRAEADFANAMDRFLAELTKMTEAWRATYTPSISEATYSAPTKGTRRYLRVMREGPGGGSSLHCFVEKATGNIYKPASWKAPTRNHVRGNIYRDDRMTWMTPHGVASAR